MAPRAPGIDVLPAVVIVAADAIADQVLLELLEPLERRLSGRSATAAAQVSPSRITLELTVTGTSTGDALTDAQAAGDEVLTALDEIAGPGHLCKLISVLIETPQAQAERRADAQEAVDLAGIAEIAQLRSQLLGRPVTPQSASRTAQRAGFPAPLATLAGGPIYHRPSVRAFFALEDARVRPRGVSDAAGTTPALAQRQALAGLLEHAGHRGQDIPAEAAELASRPHAIMGESLLRVITVLGGATEVAGQLGVTPRTVQRWVAGARQALHASGPQS